ALHQRRSLAGTLYFAARSGDGAVPHRRQEHQRNLAGRQTAQEGSRGSPAQQGANRSRRGAYALLRGEKMTLLFSPHIPFIALFFVFVCVFAWAHWANRG